MSRVIKLQLPQPPSINHYWGLGIRNGKPYKYLNNAGRKFRKDSMILCRGYFETHFSGPCGLRVEWYVPDRKRRDIDNILKPILDVLQYLNCYKDDSQVIRLDVTKIIEKGCSSYVIITLEELVEITC